MTNPNDTPPPGYFISEELEARGWSQRDLAFILDMPEQNVNQIISGKRGISADMAMRLSKAFDVSAQFFVNLQVAYELSRAKDPGDNVARRARLLSNLPVREMIKRGWIVETKDVAELERRILKFIGAISFDQAEIAHAAKKTHPGGGYEDATPSQLAWLFRVRQIAREMVVPRFSETGLRNALEPMRGLRSAPEETRWVPRLLMECGIRFVIVEALPSAKIDGVCTWLDKSPVIGMSLRFDRIDNFWFVLRHEIEHVLRRHGQTFAAIDADLLESAENIPEEEQIANEAAAAFCVPKRELDSFVARKNPFFAERDILGFAAKHGLHPGLVAGQLRYTLKRWDLFHKYDAKVRFAIAPDAIVDGWGNVASVGD